MDSIFFIDDEAFFARRYIEELKGNFKVSFCDSAIEAIDQIRGADEFRALVLDIQMPPPQGHSLQITNDGLDTGLWLLQEIREIVIARPLPVAILTNRLPQVIEAAVKKMSFPDQLIEVHHKTDTDAAALAMRLDILTRRWPRT